MGCKPIRPTASTKSTILLLAYTDLTQNVQCFVLKSGFRGFYFRIMRGKSVVYYGNYNMQDCKCYVQHLCV